jgi:hypothetical protein
VVDYRLRKRRPLDPRILPALLRDALANSGRREGIRIVHPLF